jgi:uncharacterized membrane protein YraQ (UPF0718 family)
MNTIMDIFLAILREAWQILAEAAPFILFGFLAAGLLKALIPQELVARHLGRRTTGAVIKASLLGIPMPLCSCGVIPAAVGLRQQGASRGASAAFLVSTPESGVDSIAITWALLDPVMTVIRPIAAFVTATLTGVLINLLPEESLENTRIPPNQSGCSCPSKESGSSPPQKTETLAAKIGSGLDYAFTALLKDIGGWLLLGVGLAGGISALVPDGLLASIFEHQNSSLLIMLLVSVPLYMCASASTPIAASLVLKGLSPGAALVFLLAGPATNAATITVIARHWGRAATIIYLAVITVCSVAFGWMVNQLYAWADLDITRWLSQATDEGTEWWGVLCAMVLLGLIFRAFLTRETLPHHNERS